MSALHLESKILVRRHAGLTAGFRSAAAEMPATAEFVQEEAAPSDKEHAHRERKREIGIKQVAAAIRPTIPCVLNIETAIAGVCPAITDENGRGEVQSSQ